VNPFLVGEPGSWLVVALLAAVLALDDTAFAQTWLSLPAPAGLLTGLVLGEPLVGLAVGVLCQCVMLGNLPVGVSVALDPVTAVVGVTAGAVFAGWAPASLLAAGGAARWGWLLLACCLASLAGHAVIAGERRLHLAWMQEGARTLRDGKVARVERLHARCLVVTAVRGGLLATVWAAVTVAGWLPLYAVLPASVVAALGLLPLAAPGVAVGTIVERFGYRAAAPAVAAWGAAAFLATRYLG
jgi:mannose/fructose/N-acetylgalactosamine-specific phosphotransferase system component IIC